MKIVAITQARMGSTRFPGKVLKEVNGQSLLELHLERIGRSKMVTEIIVATTTNSKDDVLADYCAAKNIHCFRGSEDDVLSRYYHAAKNAGADWVVRVTSDCPLIDAELMDEVIEKTIAGKYDYGTNVFEETFPDGVDVEVLSFAALERSNQAAFEKHDREHVTTFLRREADVNGGKEFRCFGLNSPVNYHHIRLTVDHEDDYLLVKQLVEAIGPHASWKAYAQYVESHPGLLALNAHYVRNAYLKK
ncbi:MAG: glycosyltransferase family protein [Chitinophagales bacterium]